MNVQTTLLGPRRIQRRGMRARLPVGAAFVGRPSRLGNMFVVEKLPRSLFGEFGDDPHRVFDRTSRVRCHEAGVGIYPDEFAATVVAVRMYELHTGPMGSHEYGSDMLAHIRSLRGRDIACYCRLTGPEGNRWPCHGNSILRWANDLPEDDFDEGADL